MSRRQSAFDEITNGTGCPGDSRPLTRLLGPEPENLSKPPHASSRYDASAAALSRRKTKNERVQCQHGQNSNLPENPKPTGPVVALRRQRGNWAAKPDASSAIRPKPYDAKSAKTTIPKKFVTVTIRTQGIVAAAFNDIPVRTRGDMNRIDVSLQHESRRGAIIEPRFVNRTEIQNPELQHCRKGRS